MKHEELSEDVVNFPNLKKRSGIIIPTALKEPTHKQDNGQLSNYSFEDMPWFETVEIGDKVLVKLRSTGKSLKTIVKITTSSFVLRGGDGQQMVIDKKNKIIEPFFE